MTAATTHHRRARSREAGVRDLASATSPVPAEPNGATNAGATNAGATNAGATNAGAVPVAGLLARAYSAIGSRATRVLARYSALLGVLLVADVLTTRDHHLRSTFGYILPVPASGAGEAVVLVAGWVLLRLARGLGSGKRAEAQMAAAISALVVLVDLARVPRRPIEAVLAAVMLTGLIVYRDHFTAAADPRGRSFAVKAAAQILAFATGLGLILLYLPGHVPGSVSFGLRLREATLSLVGFGGWIPVSGELFADLFHTVMLLFGILAAAALVLFWLRPVQPTCELSHEDEQRLADLLRTQGARDSLGYFALRRDKAVVWSTSGKAAITYRVLNGVALASGDPLGDPEAWPGAMTAFRHVAERFAWTPAVMGCSELGATVYQRVLNLSALELGDEAIVDTAGFSLQGRAMRGVRQACGRVERAGYTTLVRRVAELAPAEIAELVTCAQAWRGDDVERGFSMALSRLGDSADPDCVVVTARRDGQLAGMLHFVPWGPDGLSLDLMRRDRNADNGLNEFMIAGLVQACPQLGVTRVSLNFAVFRAALDRGGRIGAGPVLRGWRRILLIASRWYQIDSLYRFNDKFAPRWEPRFFAYARTRDIPRVALAALEAEAFVVRPRLVTRLLGR